jgi:hypothetical protein
MAFYRFKPAIRLVNSSGAVIAGPLKLWLPDSDAQGIILNGGTPKYAPELISYTNLAWEERWKFLGFRPQVDLVFDLATAEGKSGFANLFMYYNAAIRSETYCALEFNALHDTCTVWRGMYPTSDWSPQPVLGRQRIGYEITVSLRAKALISAPGEWSAGVW